MSRDVPMGNQQATLSEGEIGWLAGIVEGEGTIALTARTKHWNGWTGMGADVTFSVTNKDTLILDKVTSLVTRLTGFTPSMQEQVSVPLYRADGTKYVNYDGLIRHVRFKRMVPVLIVVRTIQPHLAGQKAILARLAIQFLERRLARKGKHTKHGPSWYDGYDWATVAKFYKLRNKPLPPSIQRVLNEHEQTQLPLAG